MHIWMSLPGVNCFYLSSFKQFKYRQCVIHAYLRGKSILGTYILSLWSCHLRIYRYSLVQGKKTGKARVHKRNVICWKPYLDFETRMPFQFRSTVSNAITAQLPVPEVDVKSRRPSSRLGRNGLSWPKRPIKQKKKLQMGIR